MDQCKKDLLTIGYCVVPNVISREEIKILRDLYASTFSKNKLATLKPSDFLKEENISNIIFDTNVIKAIEMIVGKEFCIYPDFTIRKSLYIPWHTDTSYLSIQDTDSHEASDMVQMSIYLQDNDYEAGGGLEIIPGR